MLQIARKPAALYSRDAAFDARIGRKRFSTPFQLETQKAKA
jgi:hypothetical protein